MIYNRQRIQLPSRDAEVAEPITVCKDRTWSEVSRKAFWRLLCDEIHCSSAAPRGGTLNKKESPDHRPEIALLSQLFRCAFLGSPVLPSAPRCFRLVAAVHNVSHEIPERHLCV
jgi:hypothetical protein